MPIVVRRLVVGAAWAESTSALSFVSANRFTPLTPRQDEHAGTRAIMGTETVAAQTSGATTDLAVLLSSMCFAVEGRASKGDVAGETAALFELYRDAAWRLPIEHELRSLSDWSLAHSARSKRSLSFTRDIAFPVLATAARDGDDNVTDDIVDKENDTNDNDNERSQHPQKKRAKLLSPTAATSVPVLFRLARIAEDPLEARYDASGRPVPLRASTASPAVAAKLSMLTVRVRAGRNVLNEPYAPRTRPLQYVTQPRTPASVYQQVKRSVRAELVNREKRRIEKLNDRHRQQVRASERSAEEALEAKFDRLFVDKNHEPHGLEPGDDNDDSGGHGLEKCDDNASDTDDNQAAVAGDDVRVEERVID